MNKLAIYLIEANLCLLAWYAFYRLLLNKEAYLSFNRFFLLGALVSALLLPLMSIPLPNWSPATSTIAFTPFSWAKLTILPVVEISSTTAYGQRLQLNGLLGLWPIIYYIGVCFFTIIFFKQLWNIYRLSKQRSATYFGKCRIILHSKDLPVFAFGKTIYWNNQLSIEDPEASVILQHELAHIKQRHTLDLLLLELVQIFFWFNPIVGLYKKSLKDVHEFLADRQALKNTDTNTYTTVLLQQVFGSNILSLSHSFNQSQLKRRIAMLNKSHITTGAWLKTLFALPLLGFMFYTFSCTPDNTDLAVAPQEEVADLTLEQINERIGRYTDELNAIYKKHPQAKMAINVVKEDSGTKTITFNKTNITDQKDVERIIDIEKKLSALYSQKDIIEPNKAASEVNPSDEVFLIVEEQPAPKGGMASFNKHLMENLKYPDSSEEGKVFVEFIISKEGKIHSTKVLKGMGEPFDSEAERVVASSPDWNPGKQKGIPVAVKMVVPISFKRN
jgi:TonB family protein